MRLLFWTNLNLNFLDWWSRTCIWQEWDECLERRQGKLRQVLFILTSVHSLGPGKLVKINQKHFKILEFLWNSMKFTEILKKRGKKPSFIYSQTQSTSVVYVECWSNSMKNDIKRQNFFEIHDVFVNRIVTTSIA